MSNATKGRRRGRIRVALAGIGNCASALVQGLSYYSAVGRSAHGLLNETLGGYRASDMDIVAAFDIDRRKVGLALEEAIFAAPNCALVFEATLRQSGVVVQMAPVLDGIAPHMTTLDDRDAFRPSTAKPVDVAAALKAAGADVLVCYVPVGADAVARHFAEACLDAQVALVNAMPSFIASDPEWGERFRRAELPLIGDDVKSQFGATIVHRALASLIEQRGGRLDRTYQLNVGGNTDFANMLDRTRIQSKKISKTRAVRAVMTEGVAERSVHVGPSDHIAWLGDNKIAYIRIEGRGFGGVAFEAEVRLSVQDSPNSAAVVLDAIRCARLALDRKLNGPLISASACYMKSPPIQMTDWGAHEALASFIAGKSDI